MYLRVKNSEIIYPYSIEQLRRDEKNVSFQNPITNEVLGEWGVYEVSKTPKPTDYTKNVTEEVPELVNGIWTQKWVQTDSTEEEINFKIEQKWVEIREIRNQLLLETDWTMLSDSPVSSSVDDWKTYRQSLRNITSQSNPFEIVWPNKPE